MKKIIFLATVLLIALSLAVPKSTLGKDRQVPTPTGIPEQDWRNIQQKLDEMQEGDTLLFKEGHYKVHKPLVKENFNGTLKGSGKDRTIIEAVKGSKGELFKAIYYSFYKGFGINAWCSDLFSFSATKNVNVSDMTLQVNSPGIGEKGYGKNEMNSFFNIFMAPACNSSFSRVRLKGIPVEHWFLASPSHGIRLVSMHDFSTWPATPIWSTGNHTLKECDFITVGTAAYHILGVKNGTVIIGGSEEAKNRFKDCCYPIYLISNSGCDFEISHNELQDVRWIGIDILSIPGCGFPEKPSRHVITHNTISTVGFAYGIWWIDEAPFESIKVVESDNKITVNNTASILDGWGNFFHSEIEHSVKRPSEAAKGYEQRGDLASAMKYRFMSLAGTRVHLERQLPVLPEYDRFLWAARHRHTLDSVLSLALRVKDPINVETIYSEVLHWKGIVSRGLFLDRTWIQDRTDPKTVVLLQRLENINAELSILLTDREKGVGRERKDNKTNLFKERRIITQALANRSVVYRAYARNDLAEIKKALDKDEAVLDFLIYKDKEDKQKKVTAFVVRSEGSVKRIELGFIDEINKALEDHLSAIAGQRGMSRAEESFQRNPIRKRLWEPVKPHLKGVQRVFVCPDMEIATLPFETLPGDKEGTYLIEDYAFVYLQSTLDLLRKKKESSFGQGALLAGGIEYDAKDQEEQQIEEKKKSFPFAYRAAELHTLLKMPFEPLDATVREIKFISYLFKRALKKDSDIVLLTGKAATEERIKQEIKGKRYIHFATHGFFAEEGAQSDFDVLLKDERWSKRIPIEEEEKTLTGLLPGLLSGIVLAGGNLPPEEGRDDGILTAEEAAWLDLSGCELVVLSACQTGLGKPKGGENLIGLRRALHLAGARSTITSLWKVSDEAAEELMRDFYRRILIEGQGKLESLRGAQLAMLKKNRAKYGKGRPGTWGAFVLDGDWK